MQGIQSAGGELRTRILNKIAGLLKIRSGWHLAEEFSEFDDPSLEYANFQFDNSCNYLHLATELPRDWPFVTLSHSNWLVGRYWRVICVTNEINCNQMFSFFLLYLQRFQRIGIRWRGWGQKKKNGISDVSGVYELVSSVNVGTERANNWKTKSTCFSRYSDL